LEEHDCGEKLSELEQAIVSKNRQDQLKKLEARFIEVIKEHREFDNFIRDFIFYNEIPYFFSITSNSLSIGICVVAFFKINMAMAFTGRE
jgi:hypothetical protein